MDNTFWSTIAGAAISFVGVLIALRQNQATFERNLQNEREKIAKDREYAAKHSAFLKASEAVTQFILYYTSLPDRELPKNGGVPEEVSQIAVSLNALHFFSGVDTIRRTTALSQAMSIALSEAMKTKLPATFFDEEIKGIEIRIAYLEKINERLREEIVAMLGADVANPLLISQREQVAEISESISSLCSEKVELIKKKYEATEVCRDVVMSHLPTVYEMLQEVLLVARHELGFPIAADDYRAIISEATSKSQATIKDLLHKVREEVLGRMQ